MSAQAEIVAENDETVVKTTHIAAAAAFAAAAVGVLPLVGARAEEQRNEVSWKLRAVDFRASLDRTGQVKSDAFQPAAAQLKRQPDGKAEAVFDIPDFNGTVRLMAMAWTTTKHGSAQRNVVSRDPVVVTATLPRVLGHSDRGTLRLDLVNAEAPAGALGLLLTPGVNLVVS